MDNDDAPNFSYAYGGTSSPSAPSWNPALRPDHESPAPISQSAEAPVEEQTHQHAVTEKIPLEESSDEEELPTVATAPAPAPAIPTHVNDSTFDAPLNSDDDFFDRYGSGEVAQSNQDPSTSALNGHGVSGVEEDALVNGVQGLGLEEKASVESVEANGIPQTEQEIHKHDVVDTGSPEEFPAEKYEHQSESTVLEEAVNESEKAPLVGDTEAVTDDWGASGEVFDLGGKPQDAPLSPITSKETPLPTPQPDPVGTTVGDDVIGNNKLGGNAGDDLDWGNTEGEDFFGGGVTQPSNTSTSQATAPADGNTEWDLALDDDFLDEGEAAAAPFVLDDDEGFLDDEPSQPVQPAQQTSNRYNPQVTQPPTGSPYGVQTPQSTDFSQMNNSKPGSGGSIAYGGYGQPTPSQQQATRPAMTSSAQSFADKSKGGYSSPYDLPDDVVTTPRRPSARQSTGPAIQPTLPPPRSSSISSQGALPPRPPPASNMSASSLSPPSSSQSNQATMTGMPPPGQPSLSKQPSTDFFAELPVTSKPKKPSGRYTPQQTVPQHPVAPHTPPQFPPKERTSSYSSLRNEFIPDASTAPSQFRQPELPPMFPEQPSVPVRNTSLPVPAPTAPIVPSRYSPQPPPAGISPPTANVRYSPAPPSAPTANQRYSPAPPPPQGQPKPPMQPYAPRTSSPLAFHTLPQDQQEQSATTEQPPHPPSTHHAMHSVESVPRAPFRSPLEGVSENEEQGQAIPSSQAPPTTSRSGTPPPPRSGPSSTIGSPRKRSNYTPQYQPTGPNMPPVRSQSQSPESTMKHTAFRQPSYEQSSPAYGLGGSTSGFGAPSNTQNVPNIIPHKRQMSHDFDYITPQDERASDPLQRWKGHPVFTWGLGGTVVTSFPMHIPRYGGGMSQPMMKCSPGEVKIQSMKDTVPLPEEIAKFPGPLKAKSKKKEVSTWLGKGIENLEAQLKTPSLDHTLSHEQMKRFEEKVLLWKVLQVLVDNDGHLEGNVAAEAAVRKVISPDNLDSAADQEDSFATAADLVSGGRPRSNTVVQPDPIDPKAVEELRSLLTKGDREKAVWHAVDQRLWAHAMLLSSTLSKDIWKQVVQEFVRKEVKKIGRDNQALSVLYEIFAGNWEDCIDELVPASARAGFQMVSTDGAGTTQNALQGLDKWRETLSLVLSNRSTGDTAALLSLGKLLAGYGRVEAAHICFIFARASAFLSGVDDPQADVVLIGADHRANPLDLGNDLEPILLTEVYEFALSLSAPSGSHVIPHLQNYKLAHAYTLAEYGHRTDAQAYCDAIASAMKSTTKISAYYNGSFVASLDDLSKRLSQSPKDGSSSWISKPTMGKVSRQILSTFNSFVNGDDEDAASNHSGAAEVGPFAKVAGNTPTISPSQSNADLYGAYAGYGSAPATGPTPTNSRYAPSNAYAPRTSQDQARSPYEPQGRPSMESQQSNPYMPSPSLASPYAPSQTQFSPPAQRTEAPKAATYSPLKAPAAPASFSGPYQPTPPAEDHTPAFGGYRPPQTSFDEQPPSLPVETTQTSGGYTPPSMGGYEPPANSYEPSTYQPYDPDAEPDSPEKPKKKSFMDDDNDDDLAARAASLKSNKKSENDRKADEAFRKAAEADAQKQDAAAKKGGGWFGGWFKKDPNAAPGPIKAKLGEENSFYYDPELKKWVNKKGGAPEASKPIATPPPPRSGPPSRNVSAQSAGSLEPMGPPSSLPNAMSAPPSRMPTSAPMRSSSQPPPMSGPGSRASTPGIPSGDEGSGRLPVLMPPGISASGPPSRPSTGMSNASSIDDLLGAPTAKKGTVKGKKRGGRYVDVMAQK